MLNKVILTGRICSEVELKTTASDVSVCSFRLAVQRKFKNADGNYEADFINIVAWRGQADFINKYFEKGDPIEISGNIQTRFYEKDGHKVYITEVIAEEVGFTQSKKQSSDALATNDTAPSMPDTSGFIPMPDGDLPF
jgi:single-strand DNA-binding protein